MPVILLMLVGVSGCATGYDQRRIAEIAPHLEFEIPAPWELGYGIDAEQLVTARHGEDAQIFQAQLKVTADRLTMIALDPLGRRAFTATIGDAGLAFETEPWLPRNVRVANVLADVTIVYWPVGAIRGALRHSAAKILSGDRFRSISIKGREIIRVDYDAPLAAGWPRVAHYRNNVYGYDLDLRSNTVPQ